ncbi:tRNA dihydrouridine(20/20a) synthase DusA [Woodsholea maritima]|uniref:tRNA dihydrouridine(20/20a) synthase DusA n=1 Tax=Woodsholea maritima TaxID=240237 RepID=UPI0003650E8E|nr:tRNA dihydrouridine(20/20a) synthase DusA [Woodsholea maritima]
MSAITYDDRRLSVAPMMDWTDRHCRSFHRLLSKRTVLYTEMAVDQAILHGDRDYIIGFEADEHPVALQVGGSDPKHLAEAAKIAEGYGYREINLNVGCPSDRVQSGRFGACLMREPDLVAECLAAMADVVSIPVTVKHRIGVDDQDPEAALFGFVERVKHTGTKVFIVHARKAWLKGLSPKENRDIPPLDYGIVHRLKAAHPDLDIHLNGGLQDLDMALNEAQGLDGAMIGRAAYHTPWILAQADTRIYGEASDPFCDPVDAVLAYRPYIERRLGEGIGLHAMTRHILGLFHGRPGARKWRQILSTYATRPGADFSIVEQALRAMDPSVKVA